jgi:hypothetical protein
LLFARQNALGEKSPILKLASGLLFFFLPLCYTAGMITFGAVPPVSDAAETVFRWARIQDNSDWFLPVLIALLLAAYFYRRYHYDAAELKRGQRIVLLVLRCCVIAVLLLFYLHPQWERLTASSRVAVLVDTSASMAIKDTGGQDAGGQEKEDAAPNRLDILLDWVQRSELVEQLSQKHSVVLYSFDKNLKEPVQSATLTPSGEETQLGEALQDVLQREKGQPLAGIILLSDGGQNAGRSVDAPLETAQRLKIPVYAVGIGLTQQPLNFRAGNMNLPERMFPGDPFKVKIPVEMLGGEEQKRNVSAELLIQPETGDENDNAGTQIGKKEITFDKPGTVETEFDVKVADAGKYRLTVKIHSSEEDRNPEDNVQKAVVEIVDRKDKILLFASAPMRDYQFISAQIFRDKSMSVDIYLPWAKPGISQNADKILERFPATKAEMAAYDVVIAFDPNWRDLSKEQIDILEHWVARQGGGLFLVAGNVNQQDTVTGWVTDPSMEKIRAMYPVEFLAKQSVFEHRYHGEMKPLPLKFSQAGLDADFLQPADMPAESRSFWNGFPGFYGYFAVKGVKPTATLLVSAGDTASEPPVMPAVKSVLFAEQFYGSGRVLYLGSGELWRLRAADSKYFEKMVTRILRHVAQGRLQRESDRGSLAVDKQRYTLGSSAQIRITANDAQLNPLTVPVLPVDVQLPSGTHRLVDATLDPNLPGTYSVHLPLDAEGQWAIRFTVPETDTELLRTVQVQMSNLERENPCRNEPLLKEIAEKSGGVYYRSATDAMPLVKESPLYGNINFFADNDKETVLPAAAKALTELIKVRSQKAVPDIAAEENTFRFLLIAACVFLFLEWTLRRLMKLV